MSSSTPKLIETTAESVKFSSTSVTFALSDGRAVTAPLEWFPRLQTASPKERRNWELIGAGYGVHWPSLDEDVSVEAMLEGRRSMESERSFQAWLQRRSSRPRPPRKTTSN